MNKLPVYTYSDVSKTYTYKKYSTVNMFPDQDEVISYMHYNTPYQSLMVCFGLGTGKTYLSARLAYMYCEGGFEVLYMSNSLQSIEEFKRQCVQCSMDTRFGNTNNTNIKCMTYSKCARLTRQQTTECISRAGIIILDEVHNVRKQSQTFKVLKPVLDECDSKVLMISATPMVNDVSEMDGILSLTNNKITNNKTPVIYSDRTAAESQSNTLKVKYNKTRTCSLDPDINLVYSSMKGIQLEKYKSTQFNDNNDYVCTKSRQAALSVFSVLDTDIPIREQACKMDTAITEIIKHPNHKTVVFCHFVERGVKVFMQALEHMGFKEWDEDTGEGDFAVIHGKHTTQHINNILEQYNAKYHKTFNILIGSTVLTESITLFNTRAIHILDPHWNFGSVQQAIGRAIRVRSHDSLPKEDRTLDVYMHCAEGTDDERMWCVSSSKHKHITEAHAEYKKRSLHLHAAYIKHYDAPDPDNRQVFMQNDKIWDLRACFDTNRFKISWSGVHNSLGVVYSKDLVVKQHQQNTHSILKPYKDGYTIWTSCVDGKTRITNYSIRMRGRDIDFVTPDTVNKIAKDLGVYPSMDKIREHLKNQNRIIKSQICVSDFCLV